MPVSGLNHVNFQTHRALIETLRDFYCDVIGLTEGARPPFSTFGYWLYAGDQPVIHLWENDEGRNLGSPMTTFDHFAFTASDAPAFEAKLAALDIDHRVTHLPASTVKQIFLKDPAGNLLELQFNDG